MTEFKRVTKQLCFPKSSPSRANVARASRISRASTVPMMHLMLCTGYPGDNAPVFSQERTYFSELLLI